VSTRLDAKLLRAVRIIEESLDSPDPYFAKETAIDLLKGRGKLKHNVQSQQEVTGSVRLDGTIENIDDGNTEMIKAFVDALSRMAMGPAPIQPKVIDVKSLPPADVEILAEASKSLQKEKDPAAVAKE
jgi:hypothetical protein